MCNCKEEMNGTKSILLGQFLSIPEAERAKVLELSEKNKIRATWDFLELSYLFDIWNTYISPNEKEDLNCGGCRTKVVTKIREMGRVYNEHRNQ